MPRTDDRAAAFDRARTDLRTLLAASNLSQVDLAEHVGLNQSNLSRRIRRDRVDVFDLIAEKFPPAAWVAARLYLALAKIHTDTWEKLSQRPENELREAITAMESLINEIEER